MKARAIALAKRGVSLALTCQFAIPTQVSRVIYETRFSKIELSINTERARYLIQKLLFYTLIAGVAQG